MPGSKQSGAMRRRAAHGANFGAASCRRVVGICRDWLNGFGARNAEASNTAKSTPVPTTSRSRPHVSVIINLDDLVGRPGRRGQSRQSGQGVTERGAPLSAEAIRRIASDAGISAIFTNSQSQIVDVGREQRTFHGAIHKSWCSEIKGADSPVVTLRHLHFADPHFAAEQTSRTHDPSGGLTSSSADRK